MKYQIAYLLWGKLATLALRTYYAAPRETIQDEMILLHRWALKKAHCARMKGEERRHEPESNGHA